MANIVEVILDDGEVVSIGEIKPFKPSDNPLENRNNQIAYMRQFTKFQKEVLEHFDNDVLEQYAKDYLDLIEEGDCDCEEKTIEDFEDDELMHELKSRNLMPAQTIVNELFLQRFAKISSISNPLEIDSILTELETKLKIFA